MSSLIHRIKGRLIGPKALQTWLGLILLCLLVGYGFYIILWRELPQLDLAELFARISAGDLALAVVVYSLALVFAVGCWVLIMGTLSDYWGLLDHVRIYCVTNVTRRLPGTFWYVLGRVVLYERLGVPRGVTVLAGGIEFAVTVIGGLIGALLAWPFTVGAHTLNPLWLVVPLLIGVALLNPPAIRALLHRFSPQHDWSSIRYRKLLLWVALYVATWYAGGALLYVVVIMITPLGLGSLMGIIGVWCTVGIVSVIFFSFLPFGLGAIELTMTAMLSAFIPTGEALFVALLMRAIPMFCELGYGLLGVAMGLIRAKTATPLQNAENPQEVRPKPGVLPPKDG